MSQANRNKFDAIVDALGGVSATAEALGRLPSQVCQWRQRYGQFPAESFFLLRAALRRKRINVELARALCRFDEMDAPPPKRKPLRKPRQAAAE